MGTNYPVDPVDDRIREVLAGLTPDRIERDYPAWAGDLAQRQVAGRTPGYGRKLVRLVIETATEANLGRSRTPTLLIAAEGDRFANLEMKRHMPGGERLIISHAWPIPPPN